jgi:hypothetical protein
MSFVDLYQEAADTGTLTLWRSEQNASATVTITTSLSGITATAFTDASGPDFGRIDITFGAQAAGSYEWSAEIASVEVWSGHVNVGPTGRASAFLAATNDITTESSPVVTIPDAPDAMENFVPDGGTTGQVLAKASNADGDTEWVAAGGGGGGSLQDAYDGSTANPEILTSVTGGAVQIRRGTGADTDAVFAVQNGAGSATFSVTGAGVVTLSGTVDGRDISTDGATLDAHVGSTSNPHSVTAAQVGADPTGTASAAVATHVGLSDPHTQYQKESEKGAASGYASLNSGTRVAEAVEKIYETGGTTMTVGAVADNTFLRRTGSTAVGSKTTEVSSGALQINCTNSDATRAFEITTTGTNGATSKLFVGTRNPEGNVTGSPGDRYLRVSGVDSTEFIYVGASSGTAGWVSRRPIAIWTTAAYTVTSTTAANIAPASGPTLAGVVIPAGNRLYSYNNYVPIRGRFFERSGLREPA